MMIYLVKRYLGEEMKNRMTKKGISVLIVFMVLITTGVFGGLKMVYDRFQLETVDIEHDAIVSNEDTTNESIDEFEGNEYIKVVLLGTDADGLRTDSMMVMVYHKKTGTLNLFSIPRDTYIEASESLIALMKDRIWMPDYMKLTDLYSYMKRGEMESPESYTVKAIEQLMGFDIDHVVLLETSGFRKVVDSVGGVEVYVPRNLNYEDPYQNLYIHLNKGTQVLNGKKAEQFVRFRQTNDHGGYGDYGRMEMQQYFLKRFLSTLAQPENIGRMNQIISAMSEFVSTDADFLTTLSYVQYLDDVDFERIQSHMLPGDEKTINGGWYIKLKPDDELHSFVNAALEQSEQTTENSKALSIAVHNGSGRKGIAQKLSDELTSEGYTVSEVGNYGPDRKQKTRIIVTESGQGIDLLKYFHLAEIVVAPDKIDTTEDADILIIVGGADA